MSKYKCKTENGVIFAIAHNFAEAVKLFKKNGVSFKGYDAPIIIKMGSK